MRAGLGVCAAARMQATAVPGLGRPGKDFRCPGTRPRGSRAAMTPPPKERRHTRRTDAVKGTFMKFHPLHDRVVVRRITPEEKTKGGIIIPGTVQEKPSEGEIIAVGPGARDTKGVVVALTVKAGDHVLFGKWSGSEIKIDGEDLLVMKESDLLGVILKEAA